MSPNLILGLVFLAGLILVAPLIVAVTRTSFGISRRRRGQTGSGGSEVAYLAAHGQGGDHCGPGDGGGSCDGGGGGS
jgi:hypothetical protein